MSENETERAPIASADEAPLPLTTLTAPLREARRAFERNYIVAVLEQQRWSVPRTARVLGLQRPNLYRKARQLRIQLKNTGTGR